MGVAAHRRGSQKIREDIDRESKQPSALQVHIDAMQAKIDRLQAEVAQKDRELERARKAYSLRVSERNVAREEVAQVRQDLVLANDRIEHLTKWVNARASHAEEYRRRWQVVSLILVDGLQLPNSEIDELKKFIYDRKPHLKERICNDI